MTRGAADVRALGEYEQFHRRRLEETEARAEAETMEALEAAAKKAARRGRKKTGKN